MDHNSMQQQLEQLQARLDALETERRSFQRRKMNWGLLAGGLVVAAGLATAAVPFTFSANSPAIASQVNANFTNLDTRLNSLSGMIAFFPFACPVALGWTEYTPARGRFILGLPVGGTAGGVSSAGQLSPSYLQPTHAHVWSRWDATNKDWYSYGSTGTEVLLMNWSDGMDSSGVGDFPISLPDTAVSSSWLTSSDSANIPYVQLYACQRT